MHRIRASLILALLTVGMATGCTSHSAVTPEMVTPRSALRLRFDPPRAVALRTEAGDSLVLEGIEEIRGRWMESRGDSLLIRATHAEFASGRTQQFGTGAIASIALADVRMEESKSDTGKTVVLLLALGVVLAVIVGSATKEDPPPPPPKEEVETWK